MRLPLKANDRGEVIDSGGRVIANFWTVDVSCNQACANAEQYAALMNARWEAAA